MHNQQPLHIPSASLSIPPLVVSAVPSSVQPALVPSSIQSSTAAAEWEEPAWCELADEINFTVYSSREEAETDINTLQSLIPSEEVVRSRIRPLRGKIIYYFLLDTVPEYHNTIVARYVDIQ